MQQSDNPMSLLFYQLKKMELQSLIKKPLAKSAK